MGTVRVIPPSAKHLGRPIGGELKTIRNRIAHIRKNAARDIARIEMTLADLEPGFRAAMRSLAAVHDLGVRPRDTVVDSFEHGALWSSAEHLRAKYRVDVELGVSEMPGTRIPRAPEKISENPNLLWHLSVGGPEIWLQPQVLQSNLLRNARDSLVYVFMPSPMGVIFTSATVDDGPVVVAAFVAALDAFAASAIRIKYVSTSESEAWPGDTSALDPRILAGTEHPFAFLDDPEADGTFFNV